MHLHGALESVEIIFGQAVLPVGVKRHRNTG